MKIDTSTLMRFINNDLPAKKMEEIKLLIEKNDLIKLRLEEIKNFKETFKEGIKRIENTEIPSHLEKQISTPKNQFNKEEIKKKTFRDYYRIAAGIIIIFTFGSIITLLPNKTYLSQNPISKIKKNNHIHIFYNQKTLDEFLFKNNNCSDPEKFTDENNKEVFAVTCKKN